MKPWDYVPEPPAPKPPSNKGNSPIGSSPGLLSSTGGLFGSDGLLLCPLVDNFSNAFYLGVWDPAIFDTEEDCIYNFPQENVKLNYAVSSYKLIVIYRNIGKVTVTFNLSGFRKGLTTYQNNIAQIQQGTYKTLSKTMILGNNPPDNLLYTIDFNIVNPGERPQVSILRKANKGPLSIVSVTLYGNADENEKV